MSAHGAVVWTTAEAHSCESEAANRRRDETGPDAQGFVRLPRHGRYIVRHGRLEPGHYVLTLEAVETDGAGLPAVGNVKYLFGFLKSAARSPSHHAEPAQKDASRRSVSRPTLREKVFGGSESTAAVVQSCHAPQHTKEFTDAVVDTKSGLLTSEQTKLSVDVTCYSSNPEWVLLVRLSKLVVFRGVSFRASIAARPDKTLEVIPIVSPPRQSAVAAAHDSDNEHSASDDDGHSSDVDDGEPAGRHTTNSDSDNRPHFPVKHPLVPDTPMQFAEQSPRAQPPPSPVPASPLSAVSSPSPSTVFLSASSSSHYTTATLDDVEELDEAWRDVKVPLSTVVVQRARVPRGTYTVVLVRTDKKLNPLLQFKCELSVLPDGEHGGAVAGEVRVLSFGSGNDATPRRETVVCGGRSVLQLRVRQSGENVLRKKMSFRWQLACVSQSSLSVPVVPDVANADVTDTILLFKQNEPLPSRQQFHYRLQSGTYQLSVRHAAKEFSGPDALATARAITATVTIGGQSANSSESSQLLPAGPTWKKQYVFDAPVELTIELMPAGFPRKIVPSSFSAKLARLPDALSAEGIERRTRTAVPVAVAAVTVVCFLSWFLEKLQTVLCLSVGQVSVRFVLFLLGAAYIAKRRDDAAQLWQRVKTTLGDSARGFKELDEATGLQKLKILSARGAEKQRRRLEESQKL